MLFFFLDDFTDGLASGYHGSSHVEDIDEETALGNCQGASDLQSSRMIHISKTNIQSKHTTIDTRFECERGQASVKQG